MSAMRRPLPAVLLFLTAAATAGENALPLDNTEACMEGPMAQFGRYIGSWDIEDSQRQQDGSGWAAGPGARWDFVCVGNGTAVQDFWIPNDGEVGTNLRTWNAGTGSWDIAWTIKSMPGFAHITATQGEDGNIVMKYVSPLPDPLRRITFFPPDGDGWDWKLEISNDAGETWLEVYRIKATRR